MIKEAIEKIIGLASPEIKLTEINGVQYSNVSLHRNDALPLSASPPNTVKLKTLRAIVDFHKKLTEPIDIKYEEPKQIIPGINRPQFVVQSPYSVALMSDLLPHFGNVRHCYAEAECKIDEFRFGTFYDLERFVIELQSKFVLDDQIEKVISWLSNLANEKVKEVKDDSFSQSINIRTGITGKTSVKIENPMILSPWRTFADIEQPPCACILRLKEFDGAIHCTLFDADGGRWIEKAIRNICSKLKEYDESISVIG